MADEILWADYAYQGVDLDERPYLGVVRYLRNGSKRQDLTVDEVKALHARGLQLAAFWQDGASSALLGYDRGVSDAQRADAEADALGAPLTWPIHFAVDTDTTGPQVEPYFLGLLDTLKRPVGGYGGFAVVEHLSTLGIRWLIQTTSWSAGRISPAAWLLQRDHNVPSGTSRIDVDVQLNSFPNAWRPPVAAPMTPAQRKAAFIAEGLPIVEVRQWWTNDRAPATGQPAGPKNGLVNHHTGGDTTDPLRYASTILYDGRSDLPGPLCHDGLDVDRGVVYMVGTGRTNHAGKGSSDVLNMVVGESIPYDREVRSSLNDTDGNSRFYGLEMMYSGARPLPAAGWDAMVRWNAAICRFHGWQGNSAIGHREWTNTKPDPGQVDLARLRRDVRDCLALPAGQWHKSAPPPSEEDDMFTDADRATLTKIGVILNWGFDPTKDFTGPIFSEQGELTQRLRRLGSLEQILAGVKQALIDDPDVPVDPAVLGAAVDKAVSAHLEAGFDAHISVDPKVAEQQLRDLHPDGPQESLPECADPSDPTNV